MPFFKASVLCLGAFLAFVGVASPVCAQASRTWVSGVGDDANPCSRTAPCKTFAGAISKTATAGEINCLDPGGFGGVTITKSITLDCSEIFGSVLVSGTNGITVNAAGAKVILRNLDIQGLNTGGNGIAVVNAAEVIVEHCRISEFVTAAINISASGAVGQIVDTTISQVSTGIISTVSSFFALDRVRIDGTTSASIETSSGASMSVNNSVLSNSTGSAAYSTASLYIANSMFDNNVVTFNAGAAGTIRVSNNDVTNTSAAFVTTGTISSANNNRVASGSGTPNGTAIPIK
jgi:hypothetical protein